MENQDYLDGEGVQIWNKSGEYKIDESSNKAEVYGASEYDRKVGERRR